MAIKVEKIVTKNRWEDSFDWKTPTPEQQDFLSKLKNVHDISLSNEVLNHTCNEVSSLMKEIKMVNHEIRTEKNPLAKHMLEEKSKTLQEKIEHIRRVIGRKLIISSIENYPEILDFDLDKFNSHAQYYQEVLAHKNNPNMPIDYYGVYHRLISTKYGEASEFHHKSGVTIETALNYGDMLMSFSSEELDAVMSYISNPTSSSLSEKSNKFFDEYFNGISREEIVKHGANPNINWLLSKKHKAMHAHTPPASTPAEKGE